MKKLIFTIICLSLAIYCQANPIPIPPPASMPLEEMYVEISPAGDGLHATFTGDFTFDYIPIDVFLMLFPVPPDANNIRVWQDEIERGWIWSGEEYPTILPEMPTIPMIEWFGPFPKDGAVFRVDYEHDLIKRPEEFIFFYALGTGKYFPTYEKTTTAYFDILLPPGFAVAGVWLDYTPHKYEVVDRHLMITVQSYFGPIKNDLIVSLVQTPIYVATDGNDITGDGSPENPFATIQKAIDSAIDGHTIIVRPGTYTGTGNRDIDFLGKAITVRSIDPNESAVVAATVINCQSSGCGFYFHRGEDANSIVSGLTITNGFAWIGGGIYCKNSSPTIQNNIIIGNYAPWDRVEIPGFGGGISCWDSSAIITGNVITYNSVDGRGGGIFAGRSCIILSNNIITKNNAYEVYGFFPSPGHGGGISCEQSSLIIVNNTISKNHAHNLPFPWGTPGEGGGIECGNSSLSIVNTILWSDTPDEIDFDGGSTITTTYSDIQGGWLGEGNINADPCFADPDANDFHLQSTAGRWDPNTQSWVQDDITSPCIDAGNPGCPVGDEPAPNGNRINMGAYGGTAEASKSPADWRSIADLTNDWVVDFNDVGVFVSYWLDSGECIPSDLNRNQSVDFSDFAIFGQQWSDTFAIVPEITYHVADCDKEAGQTLAVAVESGETRFSVWVEGSYIHFEDMFHANCCPDKIELEMTVQGNLIEIHEMEYLTVPCDCECDFPTSAVLGPFEDGSYAVDVYEYREISNGEPLWIGLLGSVTVTIETGN